jgi:hypothetical protein
LTRAECFFHHDFRRALNCFDGLTHNDFEVAERRQWGADTIYNSRLYLTGAQSCAFGAAGL